MTKRNKNLGILDPALLKAHNYWYGLSPKGRVEIMQTIKSTKKTTTGKFHDYVKYIQKERL